MSQTPTEPANKGPESGDQTGTDKPQTQQPAGTEPAGNPGTLGEGGMRALKAEREAHAAADKQLKELQAKLKEFEDRDKTELQKATERAEAAEKAQQELAAKVTAATRKAQLSDAAKAAGAVNPDTVAALLGSVQWAEDGTPTNLQETLDGLQKSDPYLFGATPPGARDAATTTGTKPSPNQITDEETIRNMTPEEVAKATREGRFDSILKHKS